MPIDSPSLKRYISTLPSVFNPEVNRVLFAFLQAIALSDDDIANAIQIAHKDLFVRTATGANLVRLAASLGVQKPPTLGLSDTDFQNLIPNLSLKPKVIKKAFYDTADIFWGPLFSRANVTSLNSATYDLTEGDVFALALNSGVSQSVKVMPGDILALGFATADEVVAILNRFKGLTASIITNVQTGNQYVNIRTNTVGSVGKIQILDCTGFSPSKVDFTQGTYTILNLQQRVCAYNVNSNELILEIPAIIPVLKRTLKGSHHWHADATIESPVPPNNGVWQGSFFYSPTGVNGSNTITSQRCTLGTAITRGQVYPSIVVNDTSLIKNQSGMLMFDYGISTNGKVVQEGPVRYRAVPNSNTILLDPSYVFKHDHTTSCKINVILKPQAYVPRRNGTDLAIYMTSPSSARQIVQNILLSLKAAGVTIKFVIKAPKYRYIIDNPYLPEIEKSIP